MRLGSAFLCHSRMLKLNFKSLNKDLKNVSYYWTDLGNSVLKEMDFIDEETLNKRYREYHKYFPI